MHYALLVVTDQKPDEGALSRLLAPYEETEEGGKWDWWQLGGRWTGALDPDYDPDKDPRNTEVCRICAGTGKRDDALGREARANNPAYTCNGCDGTGRAVKWPTQWAKFAGDQLQVKDLKPSVQIDCFAWLRDGEWVDRGWTPTPNEKKDWARHLVALKESLRPEQWLTVVDCHI